ncbi:ABC multidrug transporter-like protein [Massarina eburnea CBS 473.64]|uniref:ABC multidrug transporter-like protein n=1 Tax=Massarina eburnea CBS 473.64 TaxID=1395130 RepID=A0A6A6S3P9_9PLEO|nr:ABC multidrug transporter-like protein [Massarina eburnea CBS 473.64]
MAEASGLSASRISWAKLEGLKAWIASGKGSARVFIRIFSHASKRDTLFLLASVIASICAGATLPLMNIIFARLVRTFSSQPSAATSPEDASRRFMSSINQYVSYILYLFIGRFILAYIAIIGFRITSLRISAAIRLRYLESVFQQPISTLDALPPGQITAIITITANILQLGISERLSSLIQATTVIGVAFMIGCIYNAELTCVTASGLVAIVAWYAFMTPRVGRKMSEMQELEREASGVARETLAGMRMVQAMGAEGKMGDMYGDLVDRTSKLGTDMSPMLASQHSPVFFTIFATYALCFWYAVKLYLEFRFANVETLVVVLMSVMTMLAHINAVSTPLTAASNAINAAKIFFTVIDAPKPITTGIQGSAVSLDNDITIQNLNFAYPTRYDVRILNNLCLTIPKGKTTAIVGPSGSGKSTIVALVQRWYELGGTDPITMYLRNGSIKIGDVNLSDIDLHWWRSQIGFVQQETFLFNDTIFKNVEYGLMGTEWENAGMDEKRKLVEQACKEAYADEYIQMLPEGYDTPVGDVGMQLSGGQRQRIAIARAIIRRPKILIFDEATSALDVASEREVQAALERVSQNRTTIVIAHRLSTIKSADKIIVLAKGVLVQEGTHESLLAEENGAYWKLVNAQQLALSTEKQEIEDIMDEKKMLKMEESKVDEKQESRLSEKEREGYTPLFSPEATMFDPMIAKDGIVVRSKAVSFVMLLAEQKRNSLGYIIMLVAAIGAACSSPAQAYLFARLVSSFAYWGEALRTNDTFLCLLLLAVAGGVGMSYFTLGWVSNWVSIRTVSKYRKEYFHDIITKRISFFDDPQNSIGLLNARIATDPSQLQQLLGINMAMVLISIFSLLGCTIVALAIHWKFALVVIGSSMPIILAGGWYRVRHEVKFEERNNEVFAESARFATEAIGAIRTVACLTLEKSICGRYEGLLKSHVEKSWVETRVSGMVFAASDSLVLLCMAFALWYGGKLLSHAEITSFEFLVVYLAVIQGSLAAGQWLSFGPNIAQVSLAAERIHAMRTSEHDTRAEARLNAAYRETHQHTPPTSPVHKGADLEFQNIWFTYPTRDVPVLQGLNISVQHGQFAAIVGSSGSGKTTVISLLERFYEPQGGLITFNGEDISKVPLDVLRKRMSLVAQEPYLFRGTIRENVLLGMETDDPVNEVTDAEVHEACTAAGIHTFITSLPAGYDTQIGNAGVTLSGGQKQRLSIARALIRNPSVLLLDEATSALDSETEKEVQEVFEKTGKGRTMLVVAHRLSTVQRADVIFVVRQGRVVEQGNHEELVSKKGVYWEMCRAQALGA